ncbi:uncharacterized protein [Sinocyclocheilus grahami]|uniref:uncharacterized protein n=1 Tax=Sinocyclocheilus grahami TaxID=75366 RepID=UPI0007AC725D|nr:PREDICTED: uncharacterized protein LOC107591137 [Sinocyclocheilus grahami]
MPNVCSEKERIITAEKKPCVQAFTRMVKVWRQGCTGHAWCMDYERRTAYYIGYRQDYRQDFKTTYKCCRGWSQFNAEAGCLYHSMRGILALLLLSIMNRNFSSDAHFGDQQHFNRLFIFVQDGSGLLFGHNGTHFHYNRIEQPPGASVEHNHSKVTAGLIGQLNPFPYTAGSVFPYGISVKHQYLREEEGGAETDRRVGLQRPALDTGDGDIIGETEPRETTCLSMPRE